MLLQTDISSGIHEFLDQEILKIGKYVMHTHQLVGALTIIAVLYVISLGIRRLIYRSRTIDVAKKFAVNKLSGYVLIVIGLLACLHILGFNISVILAGSAALLVGIGFGLQSLFNDFISGIILLLEGTLKVGDVIEVGGTIYKVQEINFRTTTVIGRDDNAAILPNSELTGNRIINWTHTDNLGRFRVEVGVDYKTPAGRMPEILQKIALKHPKICPDPAPFVRFEEFGDSAIVFSLYFFTRDIFRVEQTKSELRFEIFAALQNEGIMIPFPQRVIHQAK